MSSVKKSMASQSNLEKKRIARIGSKTKSDETISSNDDDIVTKIMKSMDSKKKLISYKKLEEWRERNQNVYSPNPEVTTSGAKQAKKFSLNKKHPLMEKCQKNLKYIKHNRCIPKQRAHVGEIFIPKNIKPNPVAKFNSTKVLNEEKNVQKKKAGIVSEKQQKSNFLPYTKEVKSVPKSVPSLQKSVNDEAVRIVNDNSESDCEFEKFIRDQKELESSSSEIESASIKRKRKKQKLGKSEKAVSDVASCIPSEFECSFSESSSEIERASVRRKRKKQNLGKSVKAVSDVASSMLLASESEYSNSESSRSSEINMASIKSKRNKQKLGKSDKAASDVASSNSHKKLDESEVSDLEMNESLTFNEDMSDSDSSEIILTPPLEANTDSKSNTSSSVNLNIPLDLTKADTESYISKNFSCAVRILRNPVLDEKVISSLKDTDKSNIALSSEGNQSKLCDDEDKISLENHSSQIKLNSDEDDCMIICEVPRSNDTSSIIEKSREYVLYENNLSYVDSNKTVSHSVLSFEPDNKSRIDLHEENNLASKSSNEFGIQILSVESLNNHLNNDSSADTARNNKEREEITLNKKFNPMTCISDEYITDYSKNKTTFNPMLLEKDFFKHAKTYSEPQTYNCDSTSLNGFKNNSSLKDAQIIKSSETINYECVPEINECLNKIDLNLINSTLKQASCSENFIKNFDNIVSGKITSLASSTESTKHSDLNCEKSTDKYACVKDKPVLPPQILEIAQKIDFKKVLSLTNESSTSVKSNLVSDSLHQSVIAKAASNSFVLPINETDNFKKLALHHRLDVQSIESSNQKLNKSISKVPNTFKTIVEKYTDSPSDELDVIVAASILDLDELKPNDIIPLIKVYLMEVKRYEEIKSAEQNVSEGLKILEETQLKKVKNLKQAVESILQLDPCSHKIANTLKLPKSDSSVIIPQSRQENINSFSEQSTSEHNISTKPEAKYCNNCGLLAKLKCLGCEKVYFCSEQCGLKFWEEGHASSCQKNPPHVKVENWI